MYAGFHGRETPPRSCPSMTSGSTWTTYQTTPSYQNMSKGVALMVLFCICFMYKIHTGQYMLLTRYCISFRMCYCTSKLFNSSEQLLSYSTIPQCRPQRLPKHHDLFYAIQPRQKCCCILLCPRSVIWPNVSFYGRILCMSQWQILDDRLLQTTLCMAHWDIE